jgi:hypothetical protein
MRRISFNLTQPQFRDRSKTETRRLGWKNAQPGEVLRAVNKIMGFRPGEKPETLGIIRLTDVRFEPLNTITLQEVIAEGFPDWSPKKFVDFFCSKMSCSPTRTVTVLEFEHVDD